jgi:hypothetical protein
MTTSGVYTLTVQRDDIIRQAMLNIGKLGEGESPSPQETIDMALKLNMMVKQWMGKADFAPGLKTWTRKRGFLFLHNNTGQYTVGPDATGWTNSFTRLVTTLASAAGTNTVTVAPGTTGIVIGDNIGIQINRGGGNGDIQWTTVSNYNSGTGVITLGANLAAAVSIGAVAYDFTTVAQNPLTIEAAVLRDSSNSNEDTPLRIFVSTQDYDILPSKVDLNNISDPTSIYYEWHLSSSQLFTDVAAAQDVTRYIVLTYLEEIQVFVNPTDNPEYPAEWFDPLCWGLSKRSAPMFNMPWTSLMQDNYTESLSIARHKEPENSSLFFQSGDD